LLLNAKEALFRHIKNNTSTYFFLLLAFIVGVSAGAFTVNGMTSVQKDELKNYFNGFLQLFDNHNIESSELLKIAAVQNLKLIAIIWVLGVSIIGIPFIYVLVGIRGFITGFSSGFIMYSLGVKGILFIMFSLLPKEIIIIPCIIIIGVNGIKFSLSIIKNKSIKQISKENLKNNFIAYSMATFFITCFVFLGILCEVYITPVFIRLISPMIAS
jgi:stage II sporulation protein M